MTNATIDTALTPKGAEEARSLGGRWARSAAFVFDEDGETKSKAPFQIHEIDMIVVSPLRRTLETLNNIFIRRLERSYHNLSPSTLILALDSIKEWSQGKHTPNRRQTKTVLRSQFPDVSFDELRTEEDTMWNRFWPNTTDGLEPETHLERRINDFNAWLCARSERNVVIVSHGTFLGKLVMNYFIEEKEIEHCQIYEYKLGCNAHLASPNHPVTDLNQEL